MPHSEAVQAQFQKTIKTMARVICQTIVDVKEKKKTVNIALSELDHYIERIVEMDKKFEYKANDLLKELYNLCMDAKDCIGKELN